MYNFEVNRAYTEKNLIYLIDNFFDVFGDGGLRPSTLDREHEQSIRLEGNRQFGRCLNNGYVHLTRPIPEQADVALERWPGFGGHRVSFRGSLYDGTGITTDYFIQDQNVMKREMVSRPRTYFHGSFDKSSEVDSLRQPENVTAYTVAWYGLMQKIQGEPENSIVYVGQDELESLLGWMGGFAPPR